MLKSNQPSHVYAITDWGHYLLHLQHLQHLQHPQQLQQLLQQPECQRSVLQYEVASKLPTDFTSLREKYPRSLESKKKYSYCSIWPDIITKPLTQINTQKTQSKYIFKCTQEWKCNKWYIKLWEMCFIWQSKKYDKQVQCHCQPVTLHMISIVAVEVLGVRYEVCRGM